MEIALALDINTGSGTIDPLVPLAGLLQMNGVDLEMNTEPLENTIFVPRSRIGGVSGNQGGEFSSDFSPDFN